MKGGVARVRARARTGVPPCSPPTCGDKGMFSCGQRQEFVWAKERSCAKYDF